MAEHSEECFRLPYSFFDDMDSHTGNSAALAVGGGRVELPLPESFADAITRNDNTSQDKPKGASRYTVTCRLVRAPGEFRADNDPTRRLEGFDAAAFEFEPFALGWQIGNDGELRFGKSFTSGGELVGGSS